MLEISPNQKDTQSLYNFVNLNSKTSLFYEKLTYPNFRPRLRNIDTDQSIVAIGVNQGSQPVGLILAETSHHQRIGEILSLFVIPEHRGYGLGKTLLTYIEEELAEHGCSQANLVYVPNSTTPYLEKILKQCHWSTPQLRMLVCSAPIINMKDASWLKLADALLSGYSIFPWMELTTQEKESIQTQQANSRWYPDILSPWTEPEIIEPLNSLGLRFQNQVVGWMITHRVAVDTIRYTKLFVREDLQRLGRAIPLLAKAIQLQLVTVADTKAVFTIVADNTPMVKFMHKRIFPHQLSIRQSWGTTKVFNIAKYSQ
ncbi:GNAT family N-acetyltransferase [Anabaena sp. UHCC 0399]|uniref:GNAT family N-acetyltransferase n=1 Tax=Anabaena sp. UHCC 0399 TaxID=3110238 RepID=UPI002B21EAC7|nr:GNAT family N-acetyltransferase [Anabaena sp. UHCC 0399]MEA5564978.1 GNAT family N-acetyltransferase [Anabaena sp. UHCC 0399]